MRMLTCAVAIVLMIVSTIASVLCGTGFWYMRRRVNKLFDLIERAGNTVRKANKLKTKQVQENVVRYKKVSDTRVLTTGTTENTAEEIVEVISEQVEEVTVENSAVIYSGDDVPVTPPNSASPVEHEQVTIEEVDENDDEIIYDAIDEIEHGDDEHCCFELRELEPIYSETDDGHGHYVRVGGGDPSSSRHRHCKKQ